MSPLNVYKKHKKSCCWVYSADPTRLVSCGQFSYTIVFHMKVIEKEPLAVVTFCRHQLVKGCSPTRLLLLPTVSKRCYCAHSHRLPVCKGDPSRSKYICVIPEYSRVWHTLSESVAVNCKVSPILNFFLTNHWLIVLFMMPSLWWNVWMRIDSAFFMLVGT